MSADQFGPSAQLRFEYATPTFQTPAARSCPGKRTTVWQPMRRSRADAPTCVGQAMPARRTTVFPSDDSASRLVRSGGQCPPVDDGDRAGQVVAVHEMYERLSDVLDLGHA